MVMEAGPEHKKETEDGRGEEDASEAILNSFNYLLSSVNLES